MSEQRQREDERRIDRASVGDPRAVAHLLEEHLPRLRAFVHLRAGSALRAREESADLVQSICRAVLAQKAGFRGGSEEEFRRWLFTVARHVVADKAKYWKRERRDPAREGARRLDDETVDSLSGVVGSLVTPSRVVSARERLERFQAAFDALPDDYREVISLSRVLELPHREVAERLGRSELATRSLLHRALSMLAAGLDRP